MSAAEAVAAASEAAARAQSVMERVQAQRSGSARSSVVAASMSAAAAGGAAGGELTALSTDTGVASRRSSAVSEAARLALPSGGGGGGGGASGSAQRTSASGPALPPVQPVGPRASSQLQHRRLEDTFTDELNVSAGVIDDGDAPWMDEQQHHQQQQQQQQQPAVHDERVEPVITGKSAASTASRRDAGGRLLIAADHHQLPSAGEMQARASSAGSQLSSSSSRYGVPMLEQQTPSAAAPRTPHTPESAAMRRLQQRVNAVATGREVSGLARSPTGRAGDLGATGSSSGERSPQWRGTGRAALPGWYPPVDADKPHPSSGAGTPSGPPARQAPKLAVTRTRFVANEDECGELLEVAADSTEMPAGRRAAMAARDAASAAAVAALSEPAGGGGAAGAQLYGGAVRSTPSTRPPGGAADALVTRMGPLLATTGQVAAYDMLPDDADTPSVTVSLHKGCVYAAGEALLGTIAVTVPHGCMVEQVRLTVLGEETVTVSAAGDEVSSATNVCCNAQLLVFARDAHTPSLNVGVHRFPFRVLLDSTLPRTCEFTVGSIRYSVIGVANVHSHTDGRSVAVSCSEPIAVLESTEVERDTLSKLPRRTVHGGTRERAVMASLDRRVYYVGDVARLSIDVANDADDAVDSLLVQVQQQVVCPVGAPPLMVDEFAYDSVKVAPGGRFRSTLSVPLSYPLPSVVKSTFLELRYMLVVVLCSASGRVQVSVPVHVFDNPKTLVEKNIEVSERIPVPVELLQLRAMDDDGDDYDRSDAASGVGGGGNSESDDSMALPAPNVGGAQPRVLKLALPLGTGDAKSVSPTTPQLAAGVAALSVRDRQVQAQRLQLPLGDLVGTASEMTDRGGPLPSSVRRNGAPPSPALSGARATGESSVPAPTLQDAGAERLALKSRLGAPVDDAEFDKLLTRVGVHREVLGPVLAHRLADACEKNADRAVAVAPYTVVGAVQLICTMHVDDVEAGMRLLSILSGLDNAEAEIHAAGGVPHIVAALSVPRPEVWVDSVHVLRNISINTVCATALLQTSVVPQILRVAQQLHDHERVRTDVAKFVRNMAFYPRARSELVEGEVIPLLCAYMSLGEEECVRHAMRAMAILSSDPQNAYACSKAQGSEKALRWMDHIVQKQAADVQVRLKSMTSETEARQRNYAEMMKSAATILLHVPLRHSSDAVRPLLRCIAQVDDEEVVTACAAALRPIVAHTEEARLALVALDGVSQLVQAFDLPTVVLVAARHLLACLVHVSFTLEGALLLLRSRATVEPLLSRLADCPDAESCALAAHLRALLAEYQPALALNL